MKKASRIAIFKDALGIGIDVSKAELAIVGVVNKEPLLKTIKNNMKAIEVFMCALKQAGYQGVWCAEYEGPEREGGVGYAKCCAWLKANL